MLYELHSLTGVVIYKIIFLSIKSELKKRLSEIKDSEAGKSVKDMVNNIKEIVTWMLITAIVCSF